MLSFFKIVLAILGHFKSHMDFWMGFSVSAKNFIGILRRIASNL